MQRRSEAITSSYGSPSAPIDSPDLRRTLNLTSSPGHVLTASVLPAVLPCTAAALLPRENIVDVELQSEG